MQRELTFEASLGHLGEHLDQLVGRATRAAAELRADSSTLLDDVRAWRAQLDRVRVDAELARMDARDELARARARLDEQRMAVAARLDEAATASRAAWRAVRDGIDDALDDLRGVLDGSSGVHAPPA